MSDDLDPQTLGLSLISHTNVGKTTLARTLLRADIGEVRDEAHVTREAEPYTMIESPAGDRLQLWDTPGFGDSVRLARRLAQAGNPLGWFMTEVWDRFRDRAFWSGQRAVRNVLEQADVVLYLVNAAETPEDVGYLDAELEVLDLAAKPVVVLLNQLGRPQTPAAETQELERWRRRTAEARCVRQVLALDAFARCWVQEDALLGAVAGVLPADRHAAFDRLRAAWRQRSSATWHASMAVLAQRLVRAALDREAIEDGGLGGRLRDVGALLGLRREGASTPRELAMQRLAARLAEDIRQCTDRLIDLHRLEGHATDVVLTRLAEHYAVQEPVNEGRAAVWGGAVAGALAGLKADVLSGGMTLGGGLLAGGLLGALGAAGLARGFNLLRGVETPTLGWAPEVLDEQVRSALLGYLAVAHYGRGRGPWAEEEGPAFWQDSVQAVVAERHEALQAMWVELQSLRQAGAGPQDAGELVARLQAWLVEVSRTLLWRLYPGAVLD
ncbi:GTPase [Caldimonas brevitalea]|uniref:GTP-binding protein n=1 Tax=Caldimonas brevitalea TaxID=413882 RepID=A0A0G3BP13_9BURK|nr:GTPase [Caldimonas brevitalea]AKJ29733.1 GTP-binding protein [Caldimonas brevitalea]